MARKLGLIVGGVIMLTVGAALLLPAAAGPRKEETVGDQITEALASVEDAFESTWDKAFEASWREAFDEGVGDDVKSRFRQTFRASFEDTFKEAFEEAWGEAAEHMEHLGEIGGWSADGSFDAGKTRWEDTLTFEEDAAGLSRIDLSTVNGDVRIEGTDGDTVRIVASRVVRSTDEVKGAAYREEFRPILARDDETLIVKTHYHDEGKQTPDHVKESKMSFEVWLPARFEVAAKTVNGRVDVEGTHDDATLHTVNGALSFVTDENVSGGVHGKTVNGSITVDAPGLSDDSQLETVNGSIAVKSENAIAGLRVKTLNGSIDLTVPGDAAFDLYGKVSMHGSIDTPWGRPEKKRRLFGASYETSVNGGGHDVRLETFNGSVAVHAAD
jgi:hypothetical protein